MKRPNVHPVLQEFKKDFLEQSKTLIWRQHAIWGEKALEVVCALFVMNLYVYSFFIHLACQLAIMVFHRWVRLAIA